MSNAGSCNDNMLSRKEKGERKESMKKRIVELVYKSGEVSFSQIREIASFKVRDREIENYLKELENFGIIVHNDNSRKYEPSRLWLRLDESLVNSFVRSIQTLKSIGRTAAFMSEIGSIAGIDPISNSKELFAASKIENFRFQISGEPAIIYRKLGSIK